MKWLVTGAAGFIGSRLCRRLLGEPGTAEVLGVDCFADYYPRPYKEANVAPLREDSRFRLVEANLLDADLPALLDGAEGVFHQAAQAGVRASWGQTFHIYTDNNILATQRLLEACRSRPGGPPRVVYASSSSIYGDAPQLPMREDAAPLPFSPYGVSKLAAEHLCRLYWRNFGVPTVSLRYFTVYGPGQRPDMAFHKFIRAAFLGERIDIYGDGEQTRDFTFIEDALDANLGAMRSGQPGEAYNIGGGDRVSVNQALEMLRAITGRELRVSYKERAAGDAPHTCSDASKAREAFGFAPKISLEEGLRRQADWFEKEILPLLAAPSPSA
jgi:UDP-glucose 4-epimerase